MDKKKKYIYYYTFLFCSSIVSTSTSALNASCFSSCNCNSTRYEPICGQDGYTYFSPCTAGCQNMIQDNDTMVHTYIRTYVHVYSSVRMGHCLLWIYSVALTHELIELLKVAEM